MVIPFAGSASTSCSARLPIPRAAPCSRSCAQGAASVGELAQPFGMSLPGFIKHLGILEEAGLIERQKTGRVVCCRLTGIALRGSARLARRATRRSGTTRLDRLEAFLQRKESDSMAIATDESNQTRNPADPQSPRRVRLRGVDGPAAGEPVDGAERRLRSRPKRRWTCASAGSYRIVMQGPDGELHRVGGVYRGSRAEPAPGVHAGPGRARPSASRG